VTVISRTTQQIHRSNNSKHTHTHAHCTHTLFCLTGPFFPEFLQVRPISKVNFCEVARCPSCHPTNIVIALKDSNSKNNVIKNKQVRKVPFHLLGAHCHYGKPSLCINIYHYAPPIGYSVTHGAATSLALQASVVSLKVQ